MEAKATKRKKRFSRTGLKGWQKYIPHICFALFFVVCVIAPVISMFCNITADGFRELVSSSQFGPAVGNSLLTALVAAIFSVVLASMAAYCLERTKIKCKSLFSILFAVPMLIPSISHAFGLVALFGRNGMVTNWFHATSYIYGFWGIVFGSLLYSFPVAFLMISSIMRYEDGLPHKAAAILGIPAWRRTLKITLPYMKKTLLSAFFAVFTMVITDYGVPLAIGGKMKTLSVLMYEKTVAGMNYNLGSVVGIFLLIPAVLAFVVDLLNPEHGQNNFAVEKIEQQGKIWVKVIAYLFCILLSLFVLAPIIAFCTMVFETKYPVNTAFTWQHIVNTFQRGAGEFLGYSVLYAFLVALFGTVISFLCAYTTARIKGKPSKVLHLVSMLSMAIPGIVLGLSYVIFFHGTAFYGTILIVVLVNSVHFFSSPYLMMYNTLSKLNHNLEDVGASLGIGRFRLIWNVILPAVWTTLLEMAVYFFVNSMMTISAVSFLSPPSPKPVSLMINQFEAQLLMECAALVSLMILIVNVIMKVGALLIKKYIGKVKKKK